MVEDLCTAYDWLGQAPRPVTGHERRPGRRAHPRARRRRQHLDQPRHRLAHIERQSAARVNAGPGGADPRLLNMSSSAGWSWQAGLRAAPDQTGSMRWTWAVPEAGGHDSSGGVELLGAGQRRALGDQTVPDDDGRLRYRNCAWRADEGWRADDEVRPEPVLGREVPIANPR